MFCVCIHNPAKIIFSVVNVLRIEKCEIESMEIQKYCCFTAKNIFEIINRIPLSLLNKKIIFFLFVPSLTNHLFCWFTAFNCLKNVSFFIRRNFK
jgi:hypothetical protein